MQWYHNLLAKLVCIDNKSSDAIARKFENTWLASYPRPSWVVYDNGGKLWDIPLPALFWESRKFPQPNNPQFYFVGQWLLKYDQTIKGKLAIKTSSPFEIVCIHVNGTIDSAMGWCDWMNKHPLYYSL